MPGMISSQMNECSGFHSRHHSRVDTQVEQVNNIVLETCLSTVIAFYRIYRLHEDSSPPCSTAEEDQSDHSDHDALYFPSDIPRDSMGTWCLMVPKKVK